MRVYLVGQNNLGNRGCEALVRTSVIALRSQFDDVIVRAPSLDIERDRRHWPDADKLGVEFVASPSMPQRYVLWERACRSLPMLAHLQWPRFVADQALHDELAACDLVLSIGGDNYSLDYGMASLFFFAGIAECAMRLGKPVVLWGASIGPFGAAPPVERQMVRHLSQLRLITVRESETLRYLAGLGVAKNVLMTSDSAFAMQPEPVETAGFWPREVGCGVLGLNMSPLIDAVRAKSGTSRSLAEETVQFLREVTASGWSVLLIPHVIPLDGAERNNDEAYMRKIVEQVGGDKVSLVPGHLSAPQLKYVISRCRCFIGARTHATIAALSMRVPTVSIAYSVKARGINLDLFGHSDFVLDSREVSSQSLTRSLDLLLAQEAQIRALLNEKVPAWIQRLDTASLALRNVCQVS